MVGLTRRVARLERVRAPPPAYACRACGLRHVRPLTLDLVRGLIRITGSASEPFPRTDPLCLCACCTTEPDDRRFARLSHGLPLEDDFGTCRDGHR